MMVKRRTRARLQFRHTAQALRKWSKTRLIRLILRLEGARISRTARRSVKRLSRKRGSGKRKLSAGVHIVNIKGQGKRRVRVDRNGKWKFLKGKARGSSRRRRRASTKRRTSKRRRR